MEAYGRAISLPGGEHGRRKKKEETKGRTQSMDKAG